MCECCAVCLGLAIVACVLVGPALLIAGGVVYATADCEVLEVVGVTAIRAAMRGIGMCDASFVYSPRNLSGTLTTPCPCTPNALNALDASDASDALNALDALDGANVAVCYSAAHPERYKVALLADGLYVTPHSVPLILMGVGAAMTAIPLACMLLSTLASMIENWRQPRQVEPPLGNPNGDLSRSI